MFSLKYLISLFKSPISPVTKGNNRLILFAAAVKCIGTDASPNDIAPDELACAETINAIHKLAFGFEIGGTVSTSQLYKALKSSKYFIQVDQPLEGDIVISPSGYGNGKLSNGHVAIKGELDKLMSNNSPTGTFEENYTMDTWKKRYVTLGGYPMLSFRRI